MANSLFRSVLVPGILHTFLSDVFQCQAHGKPFFLSDLFWCQACGKHFYQICFRARHVTNIFIRSFSVPGIWQTFLSDLFQCQACGKHCYQISFSAGHVTNIFIICFSASHVANIFITLIQCVSLRLKWQKKILRYCPFTANIKTHSSTGIQICHTAFSQSAGFFANSSVNCYITLHIILLEHSQVCLACCFGL